MFVAINEIFNERKYLLFRKYCARHNMHTFSDLSLEKIKMFFSQRGVGNHKYVSVVRRYNDYIAEKNLEIEPIATHEFKLEELQGNSNEYNIDAVNKALLKSDLAILECMGFSPKQVKSYKNNGFDNLRQLLKAYSRLTKKSQNLLDAKFSLFTMPTKDLLELLLGEISKISGMDVFRRRVSGESLQSIGDDVGITRERVRQISQKFEQKICTLANLVFDDLHDSDRVLLYMSECQTILSDENLDYIRYSLRRSKRIDYIDFLSAFALRKDAEKISKILSVIKEEILKPCILKTELHHQIEQLLRTEKLEFISADDCLKYFLAKSYHYLGDYVVRKNVSYGELVAVVVRDEFPNGISLYDANDLESLRRESLKRFPDLKLPSKDRAFTARLVEFLVLSDRGQYTNIENFYIEPYLRAEIEHYIEHSEENCFIYHELYHHFEDKLLKDSNLENHHAVHGLLKYYHKDEYRFERDMMYKLDTKRVSIASRVEKYVKEQGTIVSISDIRSHFRGVTAAMIFNAAIFGERMIQWDSNRYHHLDNLDISDADKNLIRQAIIENSDKYNGYCSDKLLYESVKANHPEFLQKNQIEKQISLFYIAMKLFGEQFAFRRPHIYDKSIVDSEKNGMSVAMKALYRNHLSYREYASYAKRLGWTPATTYNIFYNMLEQLFRISEDEYIKLEEVKPTSETFEQLEQIIEPHLQTKSHLALASDFKAEKLAGLGYEVNGYIIEALINNFTTKYKILYPEKSDRRFLRGVIVAENSVYKDCSDLLIEVIKPHLYKGIDKESLCELLLERKLAIGKISEDVIVYLQSLANQ